LEFQKIKMIIEPKSIGIKSRIKILKKDDLVVMEIDRKSRIIMKDGEKIKSNATIIKNNFDLPVELHTSAPVCSKTRNYLEEIDIKVKPLDGK
tara:strand:- start:293 stop:571 length:279 start_codon:yes stop_codon:yes gene_type:complete